MSEKKVDIGVLEPQNNWLLHPRFFPSKIGGKPAWLDLKNLPSNADITCKICDELLLFLCQVYAPYEEKEECFHRTLFIFICRNGSCCKTNSNENLYVLRCQLPRNNEFYSSEPYVENETQEFPMDKWPKLCYVCGVKAPSHCSKCKKTFYCSRKHQVYDWQNGHKALCPEIQKSSSDNVKDFATQAGDSLLFKEWELLVDEEDEEEDFSKSDVNKEMEKLKQLIEEKKAGSLNNISETELEQYTQTQQEDKVFNKFTKRVARHPNQVLRYDRGGQPLWITANPEQSVINIPNCQYCNGERQFEMQVMPQLLNYINVGLDVNSIDWGILAVYTCKASCTEGPAYKKEFIIKQDLSN